MNHRFPFRLAFALAGLVATPAWAQNGEAAAEAANASFHRGFTLAAFTDSRERGLSNSANRPAVRASVELLHASCAFAELELLRVSKAQYPQGQGVRLRPATAGAARTSGTTSWVACTATSPAASCRACRAIT